METIVTFKDVCKTYGQNDNLTYALKHVSFTIKKGEFVIITGPSGAGKSTILNVLGGLDTISSGLIQIEQQNIESLNETQLANYRAQKTGFVFQFYNLIPTLTVYENVALMKELKKDTLSVLDALTKVAMQEHMHKFPSQLSGGEQQRVSIARAICKKPTLLLCDEPTGALDSDTGIQVLTQLKNMCKTFGQTTIVVTHNASLEDIADRVIHIKNGVIDNIRTNDNPIDISEVNW